MVEGHLMPDHVHVCLSIPPKYAVSNVVGYTKEGAVENTFISAWRAVARLVRIAACSFS